eukprot:TRINITY_DN261_c0_g1_i12.p1 TRINITY_DN261_c0_g1~~TRINITY_DN261_c0_g1_i12.p1  ORF type:complete len:582 (-),score=170.84 TRINITY_DN261_c0_g1_i12:273-1784(-)
MEGGVDFRSEIVDTVDHIDVMILMIDAEWATSGECEAEFNLAYRKHLVSKQSPRKPTFLPVVFPNLDWNAHKHVRLLLASTNAIVVSQQKDMHEIGELLLSSIKNLGIEPRSPKVGETSSQKESQVKETRNLQKALQYWSPEDVCYFLGENGYGSLIPKFKENQVNGLDLLQSSDEELKEGLGVNSFFIRKFFGELKTQFSLDLLQGEWSCKGDIKIPGDGAEYETNAFGLKLENYGLAASGVNFIRKNPTKTTDPKTFSTSVWQGRYDPQNSFHILCKFSSTLVIEFLGQLELKTPRLGVVTASLVEKDSVSPKKFGTAVFTLRRLVGRDRLITVELPPLPLSLVSTTPKGSIRPAQLRSDNFRENFKKSLFNWRWYPKTSGGEEIRVVTIEPANIEEFDSLNGALFPMDLFAPEDYYDEIETFKFSTVRAKREKYGDWYDLLVLVKLGETEEQVKASERRGELYPWSFAGSGFSSASNFQFNWRWVKANSESFRVITLEDL